VGEAAFADWGWRIPFLVSILLLAISVWIRMSMNESPAFLKMKAEGKTSKAPLTEAFGQWKNLKIVILALVGLTAGQAVVWYTGQFYALFFLTQTLKVDGPTANILIALACCWHALLHLLRFAVGQDRPQAHHPGWLPAGRRDLLPDLQGLTHYANPALEAALQKRRWSSPPTRPAASSSSTRPAPRSSPRPATSPSKLSAASVNYENAVGARARWLPSRSATRHHLL
jgi:hypothetical protein